LAFQISFARQHCYAGPGDSISLPVELICCRQRVQLFASLDTGAAYCVFRRIYAEALGLEVERGVPMSFATANSRFEAFGHEVTISTLVSSGADFENSSLRISCGGQVQYLLNGVICLMVGGFDFGAGLEGLVGSVVE